MKRDRMEKSAGTVILPPGWRGPTLAETLNEDW